MVKSTFREEFEQYFLDHVLYIGLFPPKKDGMVSAGNPNTITSHFTKLEYEHLYRENGRHLVELLQSSEPALRGAGELIIEGDWWIRVEYAKLEQK